MKELTKEELNLLKKGNLVSKYDNTMFNNFDLGGMDKSVIKGQFPTGCADPYIYRYNGMFYLYVTTSGLTNYGLRAWKSKDLLTWVPCQGKGLKEGYVIKDVDEGNRYTQNAYAPEVYYINGKFYMIISPGPQAVSPFRGHRILVSDSPEGPFEALTSQIDGKIDGSLLIDDDETILFSHATPKGITIHPISDDMTTLGEGSIIPASDGTGAWTEGPGLTKVGDYVYLTYTGCHYQTPGYQVIYAVAKELDKTNIHTIASSFRRGASRVVLLNCDKSKGHVGLGHSINFMGPDLDSYYICYHNLDTLYPDGMTHRSVNIDRIYMTNGLMTSTNNLKGAIYPKWPSVQYYGKDNLVKENDNLLLTKESSLGRFTLEFNSRLGDEVKYVFSYVNENNYNYVTIDYPNHTLDLYNVTNKQNKLLYSASLKWNYSINDNHTLRVAYDGHLNVYFDNLRKISLDNLNLSKGRIGYAFSNNNIEIGYSAISNEANGSSNKNEFKQANMEIHASLFLEDNNLISSPNSLSSSSYLSPLVSLKSEYSYLKELRLAKDDYVRYLINVKEDSNYALNITTKKININKYINVYIDNSLYQIALNDLSKYNEDVIILTIPLDYISSGLHVITFEASENISFISFSLSKIDTNAYSYENKCDTDISSLSLVTEGYSLDLENKELKVKGRRDFASITSSLLKDASIEADIRLDNVTEERGSIGLMLRQNNYAYSDVPKQDFKDANSHVQGYYLEIKENLISLYRLNFGDVKSYYLDSKEVSIPLGTYHHYKMEIKGNDFIVELDGQIIIHVTDPLPLAQGGVALYSYRCQGAYKNISVKSGGEKLCEKVKS